MPPPIMKKWDCKPWTPKLFFDPPLAKISPNFSVYKISQKSLVWVFLFVFWTMFFEKIRCIFKILQDTVQISFIWTNFMIQSHAKLMSVLSSFSKTLFKKHLFKRKKRLFVCSHVVSAEAAGPWTRRHTHTRQEGACELPGTARPSGPIRTQYRSSHPEAGGRWQPCSPPGGNTDCRYRVQT